MAAKGTKKTTVSELEQAQDSRRFYPHSGVCQRCLRERDDLFWHQYEDAFYCVDIGRCEYRYYLQGEKQ